jgi:hypothetical protein
LECVKRISFPHKKGEAPQSPQRLTLIVAKSKAIASPRYYTSMVPSSHSQAKALLCVGP